MMLVATQQHYKSLQLRQRFTRQKKYQATGGPRRLATRALYSTTSLSPGSK